MTAPIRTRRRPPTLPDRLPEYTAFPDTGCRLWARCLTCPFPRCIHDGQEREAARRQRDEAIFRRYQEAGPGAFGAIAAEFGVSRSTVLRAVARGRNAPICEIGEICGLKGGEDHHGPDAEAHRP